MNSNSAQSPLRIWVLLGPHRGDNNQVVALATAVGLPFEIKQLNYNLLYRVKTRLLPPTLLTLTRQSRALVDGEPPDLIIAINRRAVPVIRALRRRSPHRTRAVHLGNPRVSPRHFDLVITTPQYPVPDAANVVRLPIALGPSPARLDPGNTSASLLNLSQPRRLLSIGGKTKNWSFEPNDVTAAVAALVSRCQADGGSLIVVGSPRSPAEVMRAAQIAIDGAGISTLFVPTQGPPAYVELLGAADEIFVTADSVSMISEAIATGKPVGLMPIRPTDRGLKEMARQDRRKPGIPNHPNDLRFFWAELERLGLAGTIQHPRHGVVPDVLADCAALVRRLLVQDVGPATGDDRSASAHRL